MISRKCSDPVRLIQGISYLRVVGRDLLFYWPKRFRIYPALAQAAGNEGK